MIKPKVAKQAIPLAPPMSVKSEDGAQSRRPESEINSPDSYN
jgi:hypothetical protein